MTRQQQESKTTKCAFEGCKSQARIGYRYCGMHLGKIQKAMQESGYLEPTTQDEKWRIQQI